MPFVKAFILTAALLLALFFGLGLYLQPVQGDLARLANVSERSWGWNALQPVVAIQANRLDVAPAVIVIGDSFSADNVWQSVSQAIAGRPFLTFHWKDLGAPHCLAGALRELQARYPGVHEFVVESIERAFVERFRPDAPPGPACRTPLVSSVRTPAGQAPAVRATFDPGRPMPDPFYSIRALRAEWRAYPTATASGQGYIAALRRSDLFSNRRSGLILYFRDDLDKARWTATQVDAALDNIGRLSMRLASQGARLVLAIVPDKSTVYARFFNERPALGSQDVWQGLAARGVCSVALNAVFAAEAAAAVDFYLPDNTHLGNRGYIAMGRAVAARIASAGP